MAPLASLSARISGRVQGVGFRYFAQARARCHGIRGFARNLADGSVEVVAVGERRVLDAFVQELEQGPPSGRVDRCHVHWLETWEDFPDFAIRL